MAAVVFGLLFLAQAFLYGHLGWARGGRCGAPTREGGRCRHPEPWPGRRCAAGHTRGWIASSAGGGVFFLVLALYLAAEPVSTYLP